MFTYDLYGFKYSNIEKLKHELEKILGLRFTARESSYLGYYYHGGVVGEEEFLLIENYNPDEQEWYEPKFKEIPLLLAVDGTQRADEIQRELTEQLQHILFLSRKTA